MTNNVKIDVNEIKRVFLLLEEVNDLFHQSLKYKDEETIIKFAEANYPEIRELYYHTVWNWLPKDAQKEIEDR